MSWVKRGLPITLMAFVGFLIIVDYMAVIPGVDISAKYLTSWSVILMAFGVGIGVLNVVQRERKRIIARGKYWIYSAVQLAFLFLTVAIGLGGARAITIDKSTTDAYDAVQSTPDGSLAFINFDFSTQTAPEMYPVAFAFLKHAVQKNFKFVVATFTSPDAVLYAKQALTSVDLSKYKYGADYVNLGYFPGGDTSLAAFGRDTQRLVKVDVDGKPTDKMPLMQKIRNAKDFDIWLIGNFDPTPFIRQINAPYGSKLVASSTAVGYPNYFPYYRSGQFKGLLNGVRGGAEYEKLLGYYGQANILLNILAIYQVAIVALIIAANIVFFGRRFMTK